MFLDPDSDFQKQRRGWGKDVKENSVGDLQGLFAREANSKSGDFLKSGVSMREKR